MQDIYFFSRLLVVNIRESRPGMQSPIGRRAPQPYTHALQEYTSISTTLYMHGMWARGEEWSASEIIFGFIRPLNVDN